MDRQRLEQIVREELASLANTDEDARAAAQQRIEEEAEADRLLRHVRESRGTPLPDEEGQ